MRHQARSDPLRAFVSAFDAVVRPIDMGIAHGKDRLHSMIWETVADLLPFQLLYALLFKPGHCTLAHAPGPAHAGTLTFKDDVSAQAREQIVSMISLYGVESAAYLDNVALAPLLAMLRRDPATPSPETLGPAYEAMFADLLEAYPYLLSSDRAERYMFAIPGTTCVAAFSFLAPDGCARIVFCDNEESLLHGLHTNYFRGALKIGYDGKITWWMHSWRALDDVFEADGTAMLSWWLLKQVHRQMVKDFLSIEHHYLHGINEQAQLPGDGAAPDETLLYVALAKASEASSGASDTDKAEQSEDRRAQDLVFRWESQWMCPKFRTWTSKPFAERCNTGWSIGMTSAQHFSVSTSMN